MKFNAYVNFAGCCAEALAYYEQHLGAKTLMKMTHSQSPEPEKTPPGMENAVMHARIQIGDGVLFASDGPLGHTEPMRSAYLTLSVDSNEEAERIYAALTEGGQVFMPIAETFFAHRFAMLRDRFGVNWMIIHGKQPE
jgi:PhnB protein